MNGFDVIQIIITLAVLIVASPFLGKFMKQVYEGEPHLLLKLFRPIEMVLNKITHVHQKEEMNWKEYAFALISFNFIGLIFLFLLQMFQSVLPLNPKDLPGVSWHSALNTAISFVSNTNWQGYSGEATMSYLTQMLGLAVQNFLSAATGIAVAVALARGLSRKMTDKIGNFWTDTIRGTTYILLPLSLILSTFLVSEGVIQNFSSYQEVTTVESVKQTLPMGPAASQIAIKQLGTNGGGFFNTNSAHPFENPTPLSNWLQLLSILLIPAGLAFTFGEIVKSRKQGLVIFTTMLILLCLGLGLSLWSEYSLNPAIGANALMEGKETRFGVTNSILWSIFTSAASNGSVNAMHSSLAPLSGGIAMFNIMLGEIIFGGVGSGLYGMILFVILTVFLAGLMVGRTPEYLGKKIEAKEIQMVILAVILPSAMILIGAGISVVLPVALSSLASKGPHGLSEILYAFTSAAGNNGSAFAGLNANTVYYNLTLGLAMLVGRFGVILPVLAIAGGLAVKKISPPSFGTFGTDTPLFIALLIGVILIVGGLTFFPALSLGPIMEHMLMKMGQTF
ncbi:MAG: potassium-transporting ATPase subunit KdpA [Bdellovibrionota bacterium]